MLLEGQKNDKNCIKWSFFQNFVSLFCMNDLKDFFSLVSIYLYSFWHFKEWTVPHFWGTRSCLVPFQEMPFSFLPRSFLASDVFVPASFLFRSFFRSFLRSFWKSSYTHPRKTTYFSHLWPKWRGKFEELSLRIAFESYI